jgi:hypothetical protein
MTSSIRSTLPSSALLKSFGTGESLDRRLWELPTYVAHTWPRGMDLTAFPRGTPSAPNRRGSTARQGIFKKRSGLPNTIQRASCVERSDWPELRRRTAIPFIGLLGDRRRGLQVSVDLLKRRTKTGTQTALLSVCMLLSPPRDDSRSRTQQHLAVVDRHIASIARQRNSSTSARRPRTRASGADTCHPPDDAAGLRAAPGEHSEGAHAVTGRRQSDKNGPRIQGGDHSRRSEDAKPKSLHPRGAYNSTDD